MRCKIVLNVRPESTGNILPVSYQYELVSCIYKKLTYNYNKFVNWLYLNGYNETIIQKYKLFSVSNFYIPKIKVTGDRLEILTRKIQFWISFLPDKGTMNYVNNVLLNQVIVIGDTISKVEFEIESITEYGVDDFYPTMEYLSLSPIVVTVIRRNKSIGYLSPEDNFYSEYLINHLLDKYQMIYGEEFPYDPNYNFTLLSLPKRRGIYIKRFTHQESKVIGYMYKFRMSMHPILHKLMYSTGIGDKIGLGFGCIELLDA